MKIFIVALLVIQATSFLNLRFGSKFRISDMETIENVNHKNVLKNVNGFYGLIGPNVDTKKVTTLTDLFMGDGHIQGVFFDRGNITFVNKFIRTDKLEYEERNGRVPGGFLFKIVFLFFSHLRMLPNLLGVANTALLNVNDKTYALYERDKPYLLNIDFENKLIDTIEKVPVNSLNYFSAHSKYSPESGIETMDYHVVSKTVNYYHMNEKFEPLKKISIQTKYIPIIHDFFVNRDYIIIVDSPIVMRPFHVFQNKMPVHFDTSKPTYIYVVNKRDSSIQTFEYPTSFYLFHFAKVIETPKTIEIYAPLYEEMDFSHLNIEGKYRKVVLEKSSKSVRIEKQQELEEYNLDFPISFDNKIVLRSIENNVIKGFVICQNLKPLKVINLNNRFVCGEPAIVSANGEQYLICLANSLVKTESFLIIIGLKSYRIQEFSLGNRSLNIGFHSIFLQHKKNLVY